MRRRQTAPASSSSKKTKKTATSPSSKTQQKKNGTPTTTERRSKRDSKDKDAADLEQKETIWQVLYNHPTFWLFVVFGIPFGGPMLFKKVSTILLLQYPHILNYGAMTAEPKFRPAVAMNEPRQVLIVGSLASSLETTSLNLKRPLTSEGIEIGYNTADTTTNFVRDGTISWLYGLRFIDRSQNVHDRAKLIVDLCGVMWRIHRSNGGGTGTGGSSGVDDDNFYGTHLSVFGPMSYDHNGNVPFWYPTLSIDYKSYLQTCHTTLLSEVGCAINGNARQEDDDDDANDSQRQCLTPFEHTLIQTQHPWTIVTNLVAQYCSEETTSNDTKNDDDEFSFFEFKAALTNLLHVFAAFYPTRSHIWFPHGDDEDQTATTEGGGEHSPDDNLQICTDQMATYVTLWYNELLDSLETIQQQQNRKSSSSTGKNKKKISKTTTTQNLDNYGMYAVENTSICSLLTMAGFLGDNDDVSDSDGGGGSTVYHPNEKIARTFCKDHPDMMLSSGTTEDDHDEQQQQKLESMIRHVIDEDLTRHLDALHKRMGY